jgi:signal transduction histidine kinase
MVPTTKFFSRLAYEDSKGRVWVGTKNAGLVKFTSLDNWEIIDQRSGLSSNYIMSITEDQKKNLVVGTISGINIINDMEVVDIINVDDGLPSNFSFSTYPTPSFLWISSNDGLIGYNSDTTVIFNHTNGLPFDIVYDILEDGRGNIWMPGKSAIVKVSLSDLEKAVKNPNYKIKLKSFDRTDGIKNSQCLGGVLSYTDKNGSFWIPTLEGVVSVKPDDTLARDNYCHIIIESISHDGRLILDDRIVIPPDADRIVIDFTGINYEQNQNLQFRYQLYPFDKNWVPSSTERQATYTNLSPGDYEFRIQAAISDTYLEPVLAKSITIESSWWQSWSARLFFVLLIVLLGYLIYKFRVRQLKNHNRRLEMMVRERTSELENQKEELSNALQNLSAARQNALQSEKMASLGVLAAGVAHEINNPLNFILGSIHLMTRMITEEKNTAAYKEFKTLLTDLDMGIERIKSIVSSLNSFSRNDHDQVTSSDLIEIIENSLTIMSHKLKERIEVIKKFPDDPVVIDGYPSKLHQVFTNLISNSSDAIEDQGSIQIEVEQDAEYAKVTIRDDGYGIPEELIHKIFDPFYTTKEVGKGTGLGMTIAFNIIKEHQGNIEVESVPGKGTVVIVSLPLKQYSLALR